MFFGVKNIVLVNFPESTTFKLGTAKWKTPNPKKSMSHATDIWLQNNGHISLIHTEGDILTHTHHKDIIC